MIRVKELTYLYRFSTCHNTQAAGMILAHFNFRMSGTRLTWYFICICKMSLSWGKFCFVRFPSPVAAYLHIETSVWELWVTDSR
jgi:hypothetical protein